MTQEEIISYLKVGRSKSVCVDVSIVEELPSFVRDVEIYNPSRVLVSFHNYGNDADGVQFWHEFVSLDDAILFLETYLKKPLEAWGNFTKTGSYPSQPIDIPKSDLSWQEVKILFSKTLPSYFYSAQL